MAVEASDKRARSDKFDADVLGATPVTKLESKVSDVEQVPIVSANLVTPITATLADDVKAL